MKTFFRRLSFFVLFLLLGALCFAESRKYEYDVTDGLANGNMWVKMKPEQKVSYIEALMEFGTYLSISRGAVEVAQKIGVQDQDVVRSLIAEQFPFRHTASEVADKMDGFYKEFSNLRIPILVALRIVNLIYEGTPKHILKDIIKSARVGVYGF